MKTHFLKGLSFLSACALGFLVACKAGANADGDALIDAGPAPAWSFPGVDGKPLSAADFKGKVVVLDFWATWCPPCVAEIPGYVELQQKYQDKGLVIVGASLDQGGAEVVKKFAAAKKINYPLGMGDDALVVAFGGVEAIPTTFIIDREGRIRYKKTGAESKESFEKKLAALLK